MSRLKTTAIKIISLLNISSTENHRENSALLSAYQVRQIRKVKAPIDSEALLFASSLYYGWSLNYVLTGSSDSFNSSISGELQSLSQSTGISFEEKLNSLNVRHDLVFRGLEQNRNSIGISINPSEVNQNFKEGSSLPIFIELTFLEDYNPNGINWEMIENNNSEIIIQSIDFQINEFKTASSKWDNTTAPDPILEIYFGEELVMTTSRTNDSLNPVFTIDATIEFDQLKDLVFVLYDDDWSDSDLIGTSVISFDDFRTGTLANRFELIFDGQIMQSTITFLPMEE